MAQRNVSRGRARVALATIVLGCIASACAPTPSPKAEAAPAQAAPAAPPAIDFAALAAQPREPGAPPIPRLRPEPEPQKAALVSPSPNERGAKKGKPLKEAAALPGTPQFYIQAYQTYWSEIEKAAGYKLSKNAEIRSAHTTLGKYNYDDLARGFIAYHGLTAMGSSEFMSETQTQFASRGKAQFLSELRNTPHVILTWSSAGQTASAVLERMALDTTVLTSAADRFYTKAVDLQRGKGKAASLPVMPKQASFDRLGLPNLAHAPYEGLVVLAGTNTPAHAPVPPIAKPTLSRILSVAAIVSVLGTDDEAMRETMTLLEDKDQARCMRFAKLNLAQCIAATRNLSEEAFCTSRHALKEPSECWSYMLGLDKPT